MEFVSAVSDNPTVIISVIVGATVLVISYLINLFNSKEENVQSPVTDTIAPKETVDHATTSKHKKKHQNEKWNQKMSKQTYTHSWMVTSLKGHTGQVTDIDFSPNGKFLVTCAEDRAVFIWSTKDFASKEHKNVRYNIEFDHASYVCWSPDSKAFVINRAAENVLEVYRVSRKTDGWISSIAKAITFPKQFEEEVVGLGVAVSGRYIMSCSAANQLVVWDLKGAVLATVDTCLLHTYRAKVSPCGRFVVASGFAPDVKVWEVVFARTGEFKQVSRAFQLAGHTSGVYDFDFSSDSARMATVSKDGSWKVFNTNIEFEKGEDPHLLVTGKYNGSGSAHLALSPNGEVVAIATGPSLALYSALSGACDKLIDNIYPTGAISRVLFDSSGDHLLTAGEKHVRVFHNVTGRRVAIASARLRLSTANNSAATKERLESSISAAETFLKSLKEPLVTKAK
uniref:Uncharacterized protein n=1 Tax=Graphocephala atropunctata TaxID=36148 RepID=A0A1B6MB85_9HEMI